jgi:hypothetical protein
MKDEDFFLVCLFYASVALAGLFFFIGCALAFCHWVLCILEGEDE